MRGWCWLWPWIILLWIRFSKVSFEGVELLLPKLAAVLDPFDGFGHRARSQTATMNPPFPVSVEQSRALEHAQVARDRRRRDLERGRQVSDGCLAMSEALEDAAANGVGKRGEDGVERAGLILNHQVK